MYAPHCLDSRRYLDYLADYGEQAQPEPRVRGSPSQIAGLSVKTHSPYHQVYRTEVASVRGGWYGALGVI